MYLSNQAVVKGLCAIRLALVLWAYTTVSVVIQSMSVKGFHATFLKFIPIAELVMMEGSMAPWGACK